MSAAYWSQWSHAEIMSMHGVEEDDYDDTDLCHDDVDIESSQHCECSNCMDCLGLSERDFM